MGLAANEPQRAASDFNLVWDALPGEPAARLALGAADELAGRRDLAARRYERVWRMDHGVVRAAFGLARCRLAAGGRAGAGAGLGEARASSRHHPAPERAAVR